MHTLIAFATQWGTKHGGINSFNTDFLTAFGAAYSSSAQVVCLVANATPQEFERAREAGVTLVPLPAAPRDDVFDASHATSGVAELKRLNLSFKSDSTIWLGHDRFTGEAAIEAAKSEGGRSALIHHMSYSRYESYAESSKSAHEKAQNQRTLFQQADVVLAIGPLLLDDLSDFVGASKPVSMLIPGLAEIEAREPPKTFTAFLSGRLSEDAARIKQGHLGIAAFAQAQRDACESGMPDALREAPKLVLRGVDFERRADTLESLPKTDQETDLKRFAEHYANRVINLNVLPYTQDRKELYRELSCASVALMPSWHEGFGLVAWEAIAAGVPLIVSKNSGVYRLLKLEHPGAEQGFVYAIDVHAAVDAPFFHEDDLKAVVTALKDIAKDPARARRKAGRLRNEVGRYTWADCVEEAVKAFGWTLQKGSIPPPEVAAPSTAVQAAATPAESSAASQPSQDSPLRMPSPLWRPGGSVADSQLLRAEEALVPFDSARQPDLHALHAWLNDAQWPQAVRLITGAGGLGKTRLALELCQQAAGWHAGLLDVGIEPKDVPSAWRTLLTFNQPLLIVIDYAETRQTVLLALVKAMLHSPPPNHRRVRFLLLARDAGEWWDILPSKDPECEMFLNGYATSGPVRLSALHESVVDRRTAYKTALTAFAKKLGVDAPNLVPELEGEHFGRPLYLQMGALLALHGERPVSAEGLTKALLNHEERYWRRLLASFGWVQPERPAAQLLALSTLAGGFATRKEAERYWVAAIGNALLLNFAALFRELCPLYPGRQGLQPVRPDLLGEALVAQELLRSDGTNLVDAVLGHSATQTVRRHALTVLARLSTRRPELHETLVEALVGHFAHCARELVGVATETIGQLPRLAEIAFERLSPAFKNQLVGLLRPLLAYESVQLAALECLVTGFMVGRWREKQSKKALSVADSASYAQDLGNHAIALANVGRDERALQSAREGLNIFKNLVGRERETYVPYYASSLNNYANRLSDMGQSEAALEHAKEALEIHRRLAQTRPDRYDPYYATSLGNYANRLSDMGQSEAALEHAKQALEIDQRLSAKYPERFAGDRFNSECFIYFLSWLCEQPATGVALPDPDATPESIRLHSRPVSKFYATFMRGCLVTDDASRAQFFTRAQLEWSMVPLASRTRARDYWLCAAAWCAKFAPEVVEKIDWQTEWRSFVTQRKGRIPHWMLEVARRLSFQWPT